jgi:dTDP-4-dehydrorhamnose reductase
VVAPSGELEVWGGVECTVNRVGDGYFDQLAASGHADRPEDLERFKALGLRTLRFPVLWERTAATAAGPFDWSWADDRLARARDLGLQVIVGFVHHGSGPRDTSLLDPEFAPKLARFAAAFARRYPWVDAYTPINEPLTTARFSGLYGHWYPHRRDAASFFEMVVRQCQAIAAAMAAVREVRPDARLVQTEDLGEVSSTPLLAYQAEFENTRRWLSLDILTGRFGPDHPLWAYALSIGVAPALLDAAAAAASPPQILGINHYVTSNRLLDERLELYPRERHGGNGRHCYVDVEAVRVKAEPAAGIADLLSAAWERYGIPLAVTEAHLNCTRDEQVRWLSEIWSAARSLRARGVPIRAVTVWSLLGAFDWDSLVTRSDGHYESGVFDLRARKPRPTALAALVRSLCESGGYDHPVLDVGGWWRRTDRLLIPPQVHAGAPVDGTGKGLPAVPDGLVPGTTRKLLITGSPGTLATAFALVCDRRGLPYELATRQHLDIAEPGQVAEALDRLQPWAVINAAGYCRVDAAEDDRRACRRGNVRGPANLARATAERGIKLLTFSSDLVFDGRADVPYLEDHPMAPLSVYGRSQAEAETLVLASDPNALVIRTSNCFGPWDESNFLTVTLRRLLRGDRVVAADDLRISPTYLPDLAHTALDLLIDDQSGIWHLANDGQATWAELARMTAERYGCPPNIEARPAAALDLRARRPPFSVLGSRRGQLLPPLGDAVGRYIRECRVQLDPSPETA